MIPDRPIFVLGPPRSGTSVLYKLLATHPGLCFLHRGFKKLPRHPRLAEALVRRGVMGATPKEGSEFWNRWWDGRLDVMTEKDAPPEVCAWYRAAVCGFQRASGRPRFLAKCPPLSVRVPWIETVFPGALYVLAVRDWRAVVASTCKKRVDNAERERREFWGIRVPGHKHLKDLPSEDSAARIYRIVHEMLEGWERAYPDRFHRVVYGRLCADPRGELRRVAEFAGLDWSAGFEASLPATLPSSNYKWSEVLAPDVLARIRESEGPVMDRLTEEALSA